MTHQGYSIKIINILIIFHEKFSFELNESVWQTEKICPAMVSGKVHTVELKNNFLLLLFSVVHVAVALNSLMEKFVVIIENNYFFYMFIDSFMCVCGCPRYEYFCGQQKIFFDVLPFSLNNPQNTHTIFFLLKNIFHSFVVSWKWGMRIFMF